MKKLLSVLAMVALFALPLNADIGSSLVVLNGVTAQGVSPTIDISGASFVRVQVWSSAGATGTVLLQVRSTRNNQTPVGPWFTVATITDPNTTGEYWSVPVSMNLRVNVSSYASGTIFAVVESHQISR